MNKIIDKVNGEEISEQELREYLNIPNNFIQSNVIRQLVRKQIVNEEVITKLSSISNCLGAENTLYGIYKLGHLAVAALNKFDSDDAHAEYEKVFSQMNDWDRNCIENLLKIDAF